MSVIDIPNCRVLRGISIGLSFCNFFCVGIGPRLYPEPIEIWPEFTRQIGSEYLWSIKVNTPYPIRPESIRQWHSELSVTQMGFYSTLRQESVVDRDPLRLILSHVWRKIQFFYSAFGIFEPMKCRAHRFCVVNLYFPPCDRSCQRAQVIIIPYEGPITSSFCRALPSGAVRRVHLCTLRKDIGSRKHLCCQWIDSQSQSSHRS